MCEVLNYELRKAVEQERVELVGHLLTIPGVDVNFTFPQDQLTCLHLAVRSGNVPLAELLVQNRADPNPPTPSDELSPLWYAMFEADSEMVEVLVEAGADVHERLVVYRGLHLGSTLLHWQAVMQGNVEMVELLLDRGVDVDALDRDGRTALMLVLKNRDLDRATVTAIATRLLQAGTDVTLRDLEGKNVLHFVAHQPHRELLPIVERMMYRGATLRAVDSDGFTPVAYALRIAKEVKSHLMYNFLAEREIRMRAPPLVTQIKSKRLT